MGADLYVTKPFSTRDLMARIERLLGTGPEDARQRDRARECHARMMLRRSMRGVPCKFDVSAGCDTIRGASFEKARMARRRSMPECRTISWIPWHGSNREEAMAEAKARGMMQEESIKSIGTEERKVIFASSLGTVFEWYDFYLYAMLAPFFAALFFPPGNETAALLSAFATYAAGFLVRPFGALVFGRIGDLVGRKYTFLVTIVVMGVVDLPRRPAADVFVDRLARADPDGHAAPAAGPGAGRRIRRRGDLRRRARAARQARLRHELDPDDGDARPLPGAARDLSVPQQHGREGRSPSGAGASRSGSRSSCWSSRSTSG